jgi:uncharacterized protein YjaG (DUF416 family)
MWYCKRTQFSINAETHNDNNQNIWFTEWSENKIAKVNANHQLLPFSDALPSILHNKEITIKRGESKEIT